MSIPAGATHVVVDIYSLRDEQKAMNNKYPYRKKDGDLWLAFVDDEWVNVLLPDPSRYHRIEKQWSGPQDGLPPVGLRVEVLWSSIKEEYVQALILAHDEDRAVFRFVTGGRKGEYQADESKFSSNKMLPNFRPLKTAEQLAAEQRETAIREIMDIADVDCRVTAARLVDAGFKREVV
jgi:hypothetical protein